MAVTNESSTDPAIIPNDHCLRLFRFLLNKYPLSESDEPTIYPQDLIQDLRRGVDGLLFIHEHGDAPKLPRCTAETHIPFGHISYMERNDAVLAAVFCPMR
jgi:hypothetical protein